jgi:hypothetical protein
MAVAGSSGGRAGSGVPSAGASGAAGEATAGAAGASMTPAGAHNFVEVCAGGKVGMDSAASTLPALDIRREYAGVKYLARTPNQILSFKSTLQVPKPPAQKQTLFIWPGLQSRDGAADPGRIGNGVLQPVLTWGPSCNPKAPPNPYDMGWWIAGMYVKTGCQGGDYLTTQLGDLLEIDMFLQDNKWVQTIRNVRMDKTVDFTVDLKGQVQNEAMWLIEVPDGSTVKPSDDTIWTQNVLTFSQPVTSCQPRAVGPADYFSAPILSKDGLHCCWDKMILKADRTVR